MLSPSEERAYEIRVYGLVQGVCGAPHFDHPGTAAEGQSFFLLMEAAYRDYLATEQHSHYPGATPASG